MTEDQYLYPQAARVELSRMLTERVGPRFENRHQEAGDLEGPFCA